MDGLSNTSKAITWTNARTRLKNWNPLPGMNAAQDLSQAVKNCSTLIPRSSWRRESSLNICDLYNEDKEPTYTVQSS